MGKKLPRFKSHAITPHRGRTTKAVPFLFLYILLIENLSLNKIVPALFLPITVHQCNEIDIIGFKKKYLHIRRFLYSCSRPLFQAFSCFNLSNQEHS